MRRANLMESELIRATKANANAAAAIGVLLIHVVTLIARQPGFDRSAFVEALESVEMDDDDKTFRVVYEKYRERIIDSVR
jgi:hypothetical protein